MKKAHSNILILVSFLLAGIVLFYGGLKEKETNEIVTLITSLSVSMAGFGLVAFQIARASNELRNDFIETSILMILSTVTGFFFLVYPEKTFLSINFGELSIFIFFWAFILFLMVLIDRRFNILR
jgi:hypothetical protein